MLARLERALNQKGEAVSHFLEKYNLPASSFYTIKKTKLVKAAVNKRYLEAIRDFEKTTADSSAEDIVNSPKHYQREGIECIDAMVQVYGRKRVAEYAEISAFKYQWRENLKGDAKNDKKKKIWYTRFSMGDDPRIVVDV